MLLIVLGLLLIIAFILLIVKFALRTLEKEWGPYRRSSQPSRTSHHPPAPSATKQSQSQSQSQPQPVHHSIEDTDVRTIRFKVAGVTFDNEDGTSRQDILRHLKFYDSPYADAEEEYDTEIEETTFDGDPALAVFVNGYQVGFVPAKIVPKVQKAMTCLAFSVDSTRITGGGTTDEGEKIYYGCNITASYIA